MNRRAGRQTDYEPVWEDSLWYATLPCVSYAVLTVTAALLRTNSHFAVFLIAAVAVGLLLIGIAQALLRALDGVERNPHCAVADSMDGNAQAHL